MRELFEWWISTMKDILWMAMILCVIFIGQHVLTEEAPELSSFQLIAITGYRYLWNLVKRGK